MKIIRYGAAGSQCVPVLTGDEQAVDVEEIIDTNRSSWLSPSGLSAMADAAHSDGAASVDLATVRIGSPIPSRGKVVCVGMNHAAHIAEVGMDTPPEPTLFLRVGDTVKGPFDQMAIPPRSAKTDYEVELAVIIGQCAAYLDAPSASSSVIAGYAISNDVSERAFQLERGGRCDKGKNCPTFNPLGPWLVTR